ncbi:MAG: hypothetical protein EA398_12565, partial [Deltaproteobacteria bacterium]
RVTGSCGTVTSTARTLTVNGPTAIISHPSAQFIGAGQNASFSVGASGASLSYQWQRRNHGSSTWSNVTNGGVFSGATTATLTLTNVPGSLHNTFYRARVTGACGSAVNSDEAALRVISADNGCGGSDPLPNPPGTSCGTCGTYQCSGSNNTVCVGSTDTQTDPQNCGTCGNDCGPNFDCLNGGCICGFELCATGSQVCCDCFEFSPTPSFPKRCAFSNADCASICSGMFEP